MKLIEDIQKILSRISDNPAYPDDVERVKAWERAVVRAFGVKDLINHEGVKVLLAKYADDVAKINEMLLTATSERLSDHERDLLIKYRDFCRWHIDLFPEAEQMIKNIEEEVKTNLSTVD